LRVVLSWSSGKDSAWALSVLRGTPGVEVVGLLSTVNEAAGRVAMHGVRRTLLAQQAAAVGLPMHEVGLPWPCDNATYEDRVGAALAAARAAGVDAIAFGDLFLADVRAYREAQLARAGLHGLFPLWGQPTGPLAAEMLRAGLRARLSCIDTRVLPATLAGAAFDDALLQSLPEGTDPLGENGEFHTFCTWAPGFARPVDVEAGAVHTDGAFTFTDLIPVGDGAHG
jgi:diphthamide synthase (EF-2-diphthine--ammonia ligase)